jgi:hypothetical protein
MPAAAIALHLGHGMLLLVRNGMLKHATSTAMQHFRGHSTNHTPRCPSITAMPETP